MDLMLSVNCQNCLALNKRLELFDLLKQKCCKNDDIAKNLLLLKTSHERSIKLLENKTKKLTDIKNKLRESAKAEELHKRKIIEYQLKLVSIDTQCQDQLKDAEKQQEKYQALLKEKDSMEEVLQMKENEMASLILNGKQSEERFMSEVQGLKDNLENFQEKMKTRQKKFQTQLASTVSFKKKYDKLVNSLLDIFKDDITVVGEPRKRFKRLINRLKSIDETAKLEAELNTPSMTPDGTTSLDTGIFSGDEDFGNPSLADDLSMSSGGSDDEFEDVPQSSHLSMSLITSPRSKYSSTTQPGLESLSGLPQISDSVLHERKSSEVITNLDSSTVVDSTDDSDAMYPALDGAVSDMNLRSLSLSCTINSPFHHVGDDVYVNSDPQDTVKSPQEVALQNLEPVNKADNLLTDPLEIDNRKCEINNAPEPADVMPPEQTTKGGAQTADKADSVAPLDFTSESCKSLARLDAEVVDWQPEKSHGSSNQNISNGLEYELNCIAPRGLTSPISSPKTFKSQTTMETMAGDLSSNTPQSLQILTSPTAKSSCELLHASSSKIITEVSDTFTEEGSDFQGPVEQNGTSVNVENASSNSSDIARVISSEYNVSTVPEMLGLNPCSVNSESVIHNNQLNVTCTKQDTDPLHLENVYVMLNELRVPTPILPFLEDSCEAYQPDQISEPSNCSSTQPFTTSPHDPLCTYNGNGEEIDKLSHFAIVSKVSVGTNTDIPQFIEASSSPIRHYQGTDVVNQHGPNLLELLAKESSSAISQAEGQCAHASTTTERSLCDKFTNTMKIFTKDVGIMTVKEPRKSVAVSPIKGRVRDTASSPIRDRVRNTASSPIRDRVRNTASSPIKCLFKGTGVNPVKANKTDAETSPIKMEVDRGMGEVGSLENDYLNSAEVSQVVPPSKENPTSQAWSKEAKLLQDVVEVLEINSGDLAGIVVNKTQVEGLRHAIEMALRKVHCKLDSPSDETFSLAGPISQRFCSFDSCELAEFCNEQHQRLHLLARDKNLEQKLCSADKQQELKMERLNNKIEKWKETMTFERESIKYKSLCNANIGRVASEYCKVIPLDSINMYSRFESNVTPQAAPLSRSIELPPASSESTCPINQESGPLPIDLPGANQPQTAENCNNSSESIVSCNVSAVDEAEKQPKIQVVSCKNGKPNYETSQFGRGLLESPIKQGPTFVSPIVSPDSTNGTSLSNINLCQNNLSVTVHSKKIIGGLTKSNVAISRIPESFDSPSRNTISTNSVVSVSKSMRIPIVAQLDNKKSPKSNVKISQCGEDLSRTHKEENNVTLDKSADEQNQSNSLFIPKLKCKNLETKETDLPREELEPVILSNQIEGNIDDSPSIISEDTSGLGHGNISSDMTADVTSDLKIDTSCSDSDLDCSTPHISEEFSNKKRRRITLSNDSRQAKDISNDKSELSTGARQSDEVIVNSRGQRKRVLTSSSENSNTDSLSLDTKTVPVRRSPRAKKVRVAHDWDSSSKGSYERGFIKFVKGGSVFVQDQSEGVVDQKEAKSCTPSTERTESLEQSSGMDIPEELDSITSSIPRQNKRVLPKDTNDEITIPDPCTVRKSNTCQTRFKPGRIVLKRSLNESLESAPSKQLRKTSRNVSGLESSNAYLKNQFEQVVQHEDSQELSSQSLASLKDQREDDINVESSQLSSSPPKPKLSTRKPSKLQKLRSSVSRIHPLANSSRSATYSEEKITNQGRELHSKNPSELRMKQSESSHHEINDKVQMEQNKADILEKFKGRECLRMAAAASGRTAVLIEANKKSLHSIARSYAQPSTSGSHPSRLRQKLVHLQPLVRPEDRINAAGGSTPLFRNPVPLANQSNALVNTQSSLKRKPLKRKSVMNHSESEPDLSLDLNKISKPLESEQQSSFLINRDIETCITNLHPLTCALTNPQASQNSSSNKIAKTDLQSTEALVAKTLKAYIAAPFFSPEVLQKAIDALSSPDLHNILPVLVRDVVKMMDDDYDTPISRCGNMSPFVPLLTPVQQQLLTLVLQLSFQHSHLQKLPYQVLQLLEYRVFRLGRAPQGDRLFWCSRLYAAICRALCLRSQALIFCWDAVYSLRARSYDIIKVVVDVWPSLFPINPSVDKACPNAQVIFHFLQSHVQKPQYQSKNCDNSWLKRLLQCPGLKVASFNSSQLGSKIFNHLIDGGDIINAPALVLLAKREDEQWAVKDIVSGKLLPAFNKWCHKSLDDVAGERVIWTLCSILRALAPERTGDTAFSLIKLLQSELLRQESNSVSSDMQEVIAIGLVLLSRHDVEKAAFALMSWKPKHGTSEGFSSCLLQYLTSLVNGGTRQLSWWENRLNIHPK